MSYPVTLYLIWSEEHGAWWKRNGYTRSIVEAGRYPEERAKGIADEANRHSHELKEVVVQDPFAEE